MIWTTAFDAHLQRLDIYQRYPQLRPLIGADYEKMASKILIVGESHYLPSGSTIHLDPDRWYNLDCGSLNDDERRYICTRGNAGSGVNQKYFARAFSIYRNIEKAILELQPQNIDTCNLFRYMAFMNYFLRPAQSGISIRRDNMDKERSFENICSLQSIFGFRYLVFVSRMAFFDFDWFYRNVNKLDQITYFSVPHPSSKWWNTKSSNYGYKNKSKLTGKERFQEIVSEIRLFEFSVTPGEYTAPD